MREGAPIAFFLPSVRGGGAQRVIVNLVRGMTQRGLSIDLVLTAAEGVFLDQLPGETRVIDLGGGRLRRSLPPLIRYLRRERPRVLVSSLSHANLTALWAARLAGGHTPVVVTIHNTMSQSTAGQGRLASVVWPPLLRAFYPWAAAMVAVSRGAADDLAQSSHLPRERIEVIYNPVITPELLALAREPVDHPWLRSDEPPVVLAVGRLTRQKDFTTLIRAFSTIRRHRSCRLVILGEGEDRASLEALVAELGVGADVALPGFRSNAIAYMAKSSLFVLSSAWEGLPTVLIEALAAGSPVVSTDCPSGPREILQDGRLGALVPVGDPAALARAMLDALERPIARVPEDCLRPYTQQAAVSHYLRVIENT